MARYSTSYAFWLRGLVALSSLSVLAAAGCRSHASSKDQTERRDANTPAQTSHPIGGTYCLDTFAHGPASTNKIHFTYNENASDGSFKDYEGDLVGDTIDSIIHEKRVAGDMDREMAKDPKLGAPPVVDGFVETTRTLHSLRSDPSGWSMGSGGQVQAFTPRNLFIAKPNVKQVGPETVGAFDAVKYSVDTDGQGQLEKSPLTLTGGLKDYAIKGNAWVERTQNCILQYSIDYDEVLKDGTERKTHYEGSTTRR